MEQHIEIIDGQEIMVKVYKPNHISKKITAHTKSTRRSGAKKAGKALLSPKE